MMIQWWEHSEKIVTDRRTDWTIHRAAWSQLKTSPIDCDRVQYYHVKHSKYKYQYKQEWNIHKPSRRADTMSSGRNTFSNTQVSVRIPRLYSKGKANVTATWVLNYPPPFVVLFKTLYDQFIKSYLCSWSIVCITGIAFSHSVIVAIKYVSKPLDRSRLNYPPPFVVWFKTLYDQFIKSYLCSWSIACITGIAFSHSVIVAIKYVSKTLDRSRLNYPPPFVVWFKTLYDQFIKSYLCSWSIACITGIAFSHSVIVAIKYVSKTLDRSRLNYPPPFVVWFKTLYDQFIKSCLCSWSIACITGIVFSHSVIVAIKYVSKTLDRSSISSTLKWPWCSIIACKSNL